MMEPVREPFPLPIAQASESKHLEIYQQKICAIIKAQVVKVVNGQTADFDKAICDVVNSIWQGGYSSGLAHMDKMHKQIDAMIEKAKIR